MKLMTKEIERKLPKLYSNEKLGLDAKIVVRFFNPCGAATWHITEGERTEDGDMRLFGLCDLGFGFPELGYVMLSELESVKGPLGLGIERDLWFGEDTTLKEVMK